MTNNSKDNEGAKESHNDQPSSSPSSADRGFSRKPLTAAFQKFSEILTNKRWNFANNNNLILATLFGGVFTYCFGKLLEVRSIMTRFTQQEHKSQEVMHFRDQQNKPVNPLQKQIIVEDQIDCQRGNHICYVVSGYPGTGKTVCAKQLIKSESENRFAFFRECKTTDKVSLEKELGDLIEFEKLRRSQEPKYFVGYVSVILLGLSGKLFFTGLPTLPWTERKQKGMVAMIALVLVAFNWASWTLICKPFYEACLSQRSRKTSLLIIDDINIPIREKDRKVLDLFKTLRKYLQVHFLSSEWDVAVNYFSSQTSFKHVSEFCQFNYENYRHPFSSIEEANQFLNSSKETRNKICLSSRVDLENFNKALVQSGWHVRDVFIKLLKNKSFQNLHGELVEHYQQRLYNFERFLSPELKSKKQSIFNDTSFKQKLIIFANEILLKSQMSETCGSVLVAQKNQIKLFLEVLNNLNMIKMKKIKNQSEVKFVSKAVSQGVGKIKCEEDSVESKQFRTLCERIVQPMVS